MLTEKEIRQKWREICTRNRPKGCTIDSGAFAIELVRWVESGLTPVAADNATLPDHEHVFVAADGRSRCVICKAPRYR